MDRGPDTSLTLRRCAPIARPIDVALALKMAGFGFAESHKLLDRIVADEIVHLRVDAAGRAALVERLAELGVVADRPV